MARGPLGDESRMGLEEVDVDAEGQRRCSCAGGGDGEEEEMVREDRTGAEEPAGVDPGAQRHRTVREQNGRCSYAVEDGVPAAGEEEDRGLAGERDGLAAEDSSLRRAAGGILDDSC